MIAQSTEISEITVERLIAAPPLEVFDAWLDPTIPGAFGHENEKLIMDLKVDGLWYWLSLGSTPHYGRFIELKRPSRLQHSWMSPNTCGLDSTVTVTFEKKGDATLMAIHHSGLPNTEMAKAHESGWTSIIGKFEKIFLTGRPSPKKRSATN